MNRCNPPWTDKILAKHWRALQSRVGAAWMPVPVTEHKDLTRVRKTVRELEDAQKKGMIDPYWIERLHENRKYVLQLEKKKPKGYHEYGCGHYGCVMPTGTPGLVIKVTTDRTEASFVAAYLSMKPGERPVGIVPYRRLIAIRSESRLKRPVFVLWRDEADYVGKIDYWISEQARDFEKDYYKQSFRKVKHLIGNCLDAARTVRQLVKTKADAPELLTEGLARMDEAWERGSAPRPGGGNLTLRLGWYLDEFYKNAEAMSSEPMGNYIGQSLTDSFNAGLLLADVHLNNIGMPTGKLAEEIGMTPIITDPGHAIALDDRYSGVQVEDL